MSTPLAVVPIFVSAGAAVMPTIVAAIASVGAIILKPRELLRLTRERPLLIGGILTTLALLVALIAFFITRPSARAATIAHPPAHVDWAKVAQRIIDRQAAGTIPVATSASTPTNSATSAPIIEAHDPSRASYAGGPSPHGLKPLWRFAPDDALFLSAPAVTSGSGKIFVAASQKDLAGMTGLLACVNAETGQPLWQVNATDDDVLKPFFSSPALTADGKYLVVGQGVHQDRDCALLCFDTANGKIKWQANTPLHIESSPAIFGDLAVVGAGAIEGPDGRAQGDPGMVIAVTISTGKELWRQRVIDPESSPAIDENGVIYIGSGFNGAAVVALRSDSDAVLKEKGQQRILWQTPAGLPITNAITIVGDMIITGGGNGDVVHSVANAQGTVLALDRKTGAIKWQTAFADSVLGPIAARDGILICPVRTGEVAALSASDGKILWHTAISGKSPVLASCAVTPEAIYALSSDGILAVLDPKDGKILEKVPLNDQAKPGTGLSTSPPQVVDGRVIVGSETGGLQCLVGTSGGAGGGANNANDRHTNQRFHPDAFRGPRQHPRRRQGGKPRQTHPRRLSRARRICRDHTGLSRRPN